MISLNTYASKVFSEHPIGIWSLDTVVDEHSPSYSTASPDAFVDDTTTTGLPMVYGSTQSLRIFPAGSGSIINSERRPWKNVKFDPDSGKIMQWLDWEGTTDYDRLRYEDYFEQELGAASIKHFGYGMFTEEGKYNSYTAEMWVRIDPRTEESLKIWGTLDTFDGLWVNDNFITLVVGNQHKSYAIENWYRPMLLSVIYMPTQSRLLINGQEVIKVEYDPTLFEFATEGEYEVQYRLSYDNRQTFDTSEYSFNGTQLSISRPDDSSVANSLGFMCYSDIHLFEVDVVSLFSYAVPDDVIKRRFVWGQGVPENNVFSSAYETQIAYLDFPFAEYANNVIYPDLWNWESGYLDGFVSSRSTLKTPNYSIPEIFLKGRSLQALYLENLYRNSDEEGETFFSFKPEYDWDQPSYFFFDTINKLTEPVQAVYGVFRQYEYNEGKGKKPLFKFVKKFSDDFVQISIEDTSIIYEVNGEEFDTQTIKTGSKFVAGLDFNKILKGTNAPLKNFFSNISDIQMYAMGNGIDTFEGAMYKIAICDTSNMARKGTDDDFKDNGVSETNPNAFHNYGTYNLMPFQQYAEFWLDVGANSYWEDSIALTTLGKNLRVDETTFTSSLDFFQINIGYDGDYKLNDSHYDFETCELKSYITFQPIDAAYNVPLKDFSNTQKLPINRCVEVDGVDLETTKFEVMNGTVVRPPSDWENWKVVIYFDVNAESVIKSPFEIKNLSLAGQAYLDEAVVGSRYGAKLKSEAMFAIYKESTPYLYLTKDSGIECLTPEGVRVPFNENEVGDFLINNLNFFIKPDYKLINEIVLTVDSRDEKYHLKYIGENEFDFFDDSGQKVEYLRLYKNGVEVKNIGADKDLPVLDDKLVLDDNQWAMIGVEFGSPVSSSNYTGAVILSPGAVFQSIAISKMTASQVSATAIIRKWREVREEEPSWSAWNATNYTYKQLISSQNYLNYPVAPDDIFAVYTGTSNIIIDDGANLELVNTKGTMLTNVSWVTYDRQPS